MLINYISTCVKLCCLNALLMHMIVPIFFARSNAQPGNLAEFEKFLLVSCL